MAARWIKIQRLSWSKRWALVQALVLLPVTALAMRLVGFKRWLAILSQFVPKLQDATSDKDSDVQQARDITRLVNVAARRGPYQASCLPHSLALWWLLRRQGIAGDLRIGVRKQANHLEAHAWVEFRGIPLNDRSDVSQRFTTFDRAIGSEGVNPV